ncbi:MAG TPA: hypothetical protein VGG43_14085 [Acidimicrobiales bacterium]
MPDDQAGNDTAEPVLGGDPACWLHQVCDTCGALVGRDNAHACAARLRSPPE